MSLVICYKMFLIFKLVCLVYLSTYINSKSRNHLVTWSSHEVILWLCWLAWSPTSLSVSINKDKEIIVSSFSRLFIHFFVSSNQVTLRFLILHSQHYGHAMSNPPSSQTSSLPLRIMPIILSSLKNWNKCIMIFLH